MLPLMMSVTWSTWSRATSSLVSAVIPPGISVVVLCPVLGDSAGRLCTVYMRWLTHSCNTVSRPVTLSRSLWRDSHHTGSLLCHTGALQHQSHSSVASESPMRRQETNHTNHISPQWMRRYKDCLHEWLHSNWLMITLAVLCNSTLMFTVCSDQDGVGCDTLRDMHLWLWRLSRGRVTGVAQYVTQARSECFLSFPQHFYQMHFIALHYSLPEEELSNSLFPWLAITLNTWTTLEIICIRWTRPIVLRVNTTLHARIYIHCCKESAVLTHQN